MNMVKFLNGIKEPKVPEFGGKGYSLAVLINNGFNVPKGFIITSTAFFEFLKRNNLMEKVQKLVSEINENNFKEKGKEIKKLILDGKIPSDIASEAEDSLKRLNIQYVSIRSSAIGEDSLKASFAGLFDTFLNLKSNLNVVLENVKKCWASLFNERAIVYRIRKGLPHSKGMAVVVQEMVNADVSGTMFTAHPDTGDKSVIIIEATWGVGETLVSGLITPDLYVMDKRILEIIKESSGRKKIMSVATSEGIKRLEVTNEKVHIFCLSHDEVNNLAKIGLKIENIFKYPQDIEWCIQVNRIWVLQSRAITSLEV